MIDSTEGKHSKSAAIEHILYVRHCADSMIIQRGNNHDDLEKSTGFSDWSFKGFILGRMGKE